MAIDPTHIQQRIIERAQSRLTEEAQQPEAIHPGEGAARFEQLMESPQGSAGGPESAGVAKPGLDPVQPAGGVADAQGPLSVGDRILASLHAGALRMPDLPGTEAAAPVGAKADIDIGDPMHQLAMQIKVAEIKTEVSLMTTAVQKSSQGVDTLLKSQ